MRLYNLEDHAEEVSFAQALRRGLGRNKGLYFPSEFPVMPDVEALLAQPFVPRSARILSAFIGDEISPRLVETMVAEAFRFPAPLKKVSAGMYALELFHGPTLAFKDFGGRFLAQSLGAVSSGVRTTVLTATSGDTGAAVAHAFYGLENIQVAVLYPKGRVSPLQEKLFGTLGANVHAFAVNSNFDGCQAMVRELFEDRAFGEEVGLTSANSINIGRLLGQVCYYFEGIAQLSPSERQRVVISVPSGNFGNLTAGLMAAAAGLPVERFIAATNVNDTVPRYLRSGRWAPQPTVATTANAMDVSQPNNWPRIEELFRKMNWSLDDLGCGRVTDEESAATVRQLDAGGYLSEPHGAIAHRVLEAELERGQTGIFLCTAHPAKFRGVVESIIGRAIQLPPALAEHADRVLLARDLNEDVDALKGVLREAWMTPAP